MFPLRSIYYCFLQIVCLLSIFSIVTQMMLFQSSHPDITLFTNQTLILTHPNPPDDKFTRCLLRAEAALHRLSLRWFLVFGSALMYHRSNNFVSGDIDVGVFHDDLRRKNITERTLMETMSRAHFKLLVRYGTTNDGQGWTLQCPKSKVHFGVFVFYRIDFPTETKNEYSWWTASYNGPCAQMPYKKCRRGFSDIQLEKFRMYGRAFDVVSKQFLIDQYGADWTTPQKYDYAQSIRIMTNLLEKPRLSYSSMKKKRIRYQQVPLGRRNSRFHRKNGRSS